MSIQRSVLTINGVEREILCDPEKDSLADAVRRLGLTGTKVGCGVGQCGACTLLLDGKAIRSCTKKMKNVPDGSVVETIEGLGTVHNLHPLQQAFLTYASIQCGFCSPGFIMSAKGLLNENPSPTRQQVRDWFTSHNNICRCTGYKPIVDAVMAAAAVMRGEKTMQDITFEVPKDNHIYGTWYPKPKGITRVLGQCDYGADVTLKMPAGTFHLALVLGKSHHAAIKGIDASEALQMPGVVRVITAKDVRGTNRILSPQGAIRCHSKQNEFPVICDITVQRYGDVVAVVAAQTREQARAAAAKVKVSLDPLPAYLTYEEAAAPDAQQIYPGTPNVYLEQPVLKGADTRGMFAKAAFVAEGSFSTSRQPHLPIEPDVAQAYPQDGGVVIQSKTQYPQGPIGVIADAIGLPKDKIRMIQNQVGASFGYAMFPVTYAVTAVCALALDAPVSLVLSYDEHQHFTGKRSPSYSNARLACDEKGKFVAMDYHCGLDHGPYTWAAGGLTAKTCRFFGYPYSVPNIRGLVQTAFTNHNVGVQFQAFGSPQAYMASEQLVDMLAEKVGMDPFDFRYQNLPMEGELCTNSVPYREYPMKKIMDLMRPYYDKAVAAAKAESTPEKKRGVGLTWGGYHVAKNLEHSDVDLELNSDGSVTCWNCWPDVGQGADTGITVHVHESLRELGLELRPNQIRLVMNDTATCPDTGSASGSRSHHCAGKATLDAAAQLVGAMRKEDGTFRTWQEMQDAHIPTRYRGKFAAKWPGIDPDTGHGWGAVGQNYILYLVEVEVEVATGKTTVLRAMEIADIGKIGNYQGVLGQAWGGFARALGFALSEDYNDVKRHATLLGAGAPRCNAVPDDIRILFHETVRGYGPHGSTGCAEGFESCGHVAILNAIANATGIRIYTLPASPEKVKAALAAKAQGNELKQAPWALGCELYERLDYLEAHPVKGAKK